MWVGRETGVTPSGGPCAVWISRESCDGAPLLSIDDDYLRWLLTTSATWWYYGRWLLLIHCESHAVVIRSWSLLKKWLVTQKSDWLLRNLIAQSDFWLINQILIVRVFCTRSGIDKYWQKYCTRKYAYHIVCVPFPYRVFQAYIGTLSAGMLD